jgi:hypothetical protein
MKIILFQVIYLRRFRKLKTLTLKGNPFCEEDTYKQYVIAFLSNIEFLDYKLIHPQAVSVFYSLKMESGLIITTVVSSNQFRRGIFDTTLCDKVCQ